MMSIRFCIVSSRSGVDVTGKFFVVCLRPFVSNSFPFPFPMPLPFPILWLNVKLNGFAAVNIGVSELLVLISCANELKSVAEELLDSIRDKHGVLTTDESIC